MYLIPWKMRVDILTREGRKVVMTVSIILFLARQVVQVVAVD